MIIYFSGTGNSKFVACSLAENLNEECVTLESLINEKKYQLQFEKSDKLILIFPIHAWQPPKFVLDYLSKVEILGSPIISAIATCGSEVGFAMNVLRKTLGKKQLRLRNFASVTMPENYVAMFNTDSEEIIKEKIDNCREFIQAITEYFKGNKSFQSAKIGAFPFSKTYVINPIFRKFVISSKPFFTDDKCINCGECVDFCPTSNIKIADGEVKFGKDCIHCMSCINKCPFEAIQYGKKTKERDRYTFKE